MVSSGSGGSAVDGRRASLVQLDGDILGKLVVAGGGDGLLKVVSTGLQTVKVRSALSVGGDLSGSALVIDPSDGLGSGVILIVLALSVLQHELGALQLGVLVAVGVLVDDDVEGEHIHFHAGFLKRVFVSGVVAVLERSGVGFLIALDGVLVDGGSVGDDYRCVDLILIVHHIDAGHKAVIIVGDSRIVSHIHAADGDLDVLVEGQTLGHGICHLIGKLGIALGGGNLAVDGVGEHLTDFHSAVGVIHRLFDLRHFVLVANLNILGSSQLADRAAGAGYKVIAQGKAGGLHGVISLGKGGAGAERTHIRFQMLGKGGGGEFGADAHIILVRVSNGC